VTKPDLGDISFGAAVDQITALREREEDRRDYDVKFHMRER
jgi:hypothetical protein